MGWGETPQRNKAPRREGPSFRHRTGGRELLSLAQAGWYLPLEKGWGRQEDEEGKRPKLSLLWIFICVSLPMSSLKLKFHLSISITQVL